MSVAGPVSESPPSLPDDPFRGTAYRAIRRLGAGGMGEVFLVEHRELGRRFVAKLPHRELAQNPVMLDRMRIEAQSLGRLNHPNIVSIVGFETTLDDRPFMITESLQGRSLAEELKARGQLATHEALALGAQLLSALSAAHAIGIVHRDIKPANLFLTQGRDGKRVLKVLDFGIARILPGVSPHAPRPLMVPTKTGVVVGTPRYVSPEGAQGKHVDQRADLYAAALVIYAMLAGRGPFDHLKGEDEVLDAHVLHEPEPPSRFMKEPIPAELDRLLLKALRKAASKRFQTADEFKALLEQVAALVRPSLVPLETVAFDARTFAASVESSSEVDARAPVARDEQNAGGSRGHAASEAPGLPAVDAVPELAATPPVQAASPTRRRIMPLLVLFLVIAAIATAVSAGAVAVIQRLAGN